MLLSRGAYYSPQCSMVWQVVKSSLIWKSAILTWNRKDKLSLAPEIWYHFLKKASPSSTALHHSWAGVLVSPSGRLWIPLLGDRLPQWCGQLLCSPPNLSFHRALPLISKSPLARRWGQFRPRPHVWDGVGTCSSAAHQFSFPFPILAVCTVEGVGTSWILWNYLRIEIWYQPCTENSALHSLPTSVFLCQMQIFIVSLIFLSLRKYNLHNNAETCYPSLLDGGTHGFIHALWTFPLEKKIPALYYFMVHLCVPSTFIYIYLLSFPL